MSLDSKVPDECKRKRNKMVPEDFTNALRKSFNWAKAERLPDESFYPLYVGEDLIEQMTAADNQIIWGRRGTGNTHLLKAFTQYINQDFNYSGMAYYISCENIKVETPADINFTNDFERMKYFARETFKGFLINITEQIIDTYEKNLSMKYIFNENPEYDIKEIKIKTDNNLTKLLELCNSGVPQITEIKATSITKHSIEKTKSKDLEISISGETKSAFLGFKGLFNKNKKNNNEEILSDQVDKKLEYKFSLSDIQKTIENLVRDLQINMLYICIDELWLIDEKNLVSFQPLFLDYLKQTFFGQNKVSIKIASIRETTKINSKTSMTRSYGLQSGHDIMEIGSLDSMQYTAEELKEKFQDILVTRINYFSEEFNEIYGEEKIVVYETNFVIDTIFKGNRNFELLISLAHEIPRNFLNIIKNCMVLLKYDLAHYFLHTYLISEVVMNIFVNDRRSNIPMNDNSVYSIINNYVIDKKEIFFLISAKDSKKIRIEINNLIYTEIIHRIPSALTPSSIMDRYKAYFVDTGKYFHCLKEYDLELYTKTLSNFRLMLPKDIAIDYEKYVIDFEKAEKDFMECPNCSAVVSKSNPVFKKYNCCYTCGFDLPNDNQ